MSGSKYTYIDSSELSRLRQDAARLRGLREDLPERIEAAVREASQNIDRRLAPIEARQREFARQIQGISTDLRQTEQAMAERIAENARQTRKALQETSAQMERQRRELRQEIHETAQRLNEQMVATENRLDSEIQDTEQRLNQQIHDTETHLVRLNEQTRQQMREQEQRLGAAIQAERLERERGLKAMSQRIDAMHQDRQRLSGIARDHLKAAETLHDFINSHYQHNHFTPGQLARLERSIASATSSLNQGAVEAALAEANRAYQNLSDLRLELEQLETEWRVWREQALQTASRLLAEAQANRKVSCVEETGEIAEVNYWTGGKLADLEMSLNSVLNRAENEDSPLSIAQMRELVEKTLPDMDNQLDCIIEEAQMEVIRSQMRVNIADLAMQALEAQGFTLQDGLYEGEDMRGGFVAKARNVAGSEVVVSVMPEGDRDRLTVDSFEPRPRAERELVQRSREIASAMRSNGLDASEPAKQSDAPSEANRDLEVVRKRKPKKQIKV